MRSFAVPIAIGMFLAAIGCGPSIRWGHRSRVYFERCYAADLDRSVPVDERRACWQQWMAHYQVGQPPDRIDYVRERILRLSPETAEILALATGGAEDPVPLTATEPEIAAEATLVAATMDGTAAEISTGAEAGSGVNEAIGSDAGTTTVPVAPEISTDAGGSSATPSAAPIAIGEPPGPAPSTIPPARVRRAARAPMMPRSQTPHCASSCQPRWDACTAQCTTERPACLRACRLALRTCARACY